MYVLIPDIISPEYILVMDEVNGEEAMAKQIFQTHF